MRGIGATNFLALVFYEELDFKEEKRRLKQPFSALVIFLILLASLSFSFSFALCCRIQKGRKEGEKERERARLSARERTLNFGSHTKKKYQYNSEFIAQISFLRNFGDTEILKGLVMLKTENRNIS